MGQKSKHAQTRVQSNLGCIDAAMLRVHSNQKIEGMLRCIIANFSVKRVGQKRNKRSTMGTQQWKEEEGDSNRAVKETGDRSWPMARGGSTMEEKREWTY